MSKPKEGHSATPTTTMVGDSSRGRQRGNGFYLYIIFRQVSGRDLNCEQFLKHEVERNNFQGLEIIDSSRCGKDEVFKIKLPSISTVTRIMPRIRDGGKRENINIVWAYERRLSRKYADCFKLATSTQPEAKEQIVNPLSAQEHKCPGGPSRESKVINRMEDKKHEELLFYIAFKNITNKTFDCDIFLLSGSKAKDGDINILSSVTCHEDVLLTVTFKSEEKAAKTLWHIRNKGHNLKERIEIVWYHKPLLPGKYLRFLDSASQATEKEVHPNDKVKQHNVASAEHPFPKTNSKCDASMSKNELQCPSPLKDPGGITGTKRAEDKKIEPFLIYVAFENIPKESFDCTQFLLTQNEVKDNQINILSTVLCGADVLLTVTFSSKTKALDTLRSIRTKGNKLKDRKEIKWYYKDSLPRKYCNCLQSVPQNRNEKVYQNDKKTKQIQRTDVNLPKQPPVHAKNPQHNPYGNKGGETKQQSTKSTAGSDEKNTKVDAIRPKEEGTCVYVSIQESVKERVLEGFLRARIGCESKATEFKVISTEIEQKTSFTMVTIRFKNKLLAREALNLLKMSNLNSETQLGCSLTSPNDTVEFRKEQLANKLNDIQNRSSKVLHELSSKTDRANDRLNKLVTPAYVSTTEYETIMDQRCALKSDIEEFKNQEKEYNRCVQDITDRLSNSITSENFEYNLSSETINFGIECCRLESGLPIYGRRFGVLKLIQENQIVIIRGETGSGKSTQLVQYLYQADFGKTGMITCTQPRKVACVSLAERVATELVTNVGQIVGYKSGLRRKISEQTKIVYQTHHSLLQECLKDPRLIKYSCIMIDEAHERSIYTDILLSIIKICLPVRPDLKVIISSATIDVEIFSEYFHGCPTVEISGRAFPVDVIWRDAEEQYHDFKNFEGAAVALAKHIHLTEGQGDILAFLPSPLDTEKCKEDLDKKLTGRTNYKCFPFHGQLHPVEQQEVFQGLPIGQRKIVFATNAAETSITIPGIKFVIDTGMAKEREFDPIRHINTLRPKIISRSSANQRKGRAGRTAPGICYRLYTRQSYEEMNPSSVPEIQRVHLGQTLLMLYEMDMDPLTCDFVEAPCADAMDSALRTLEELRCVVDGKITELGKWLAKIPLEPRLATMIKLGHDKGLLYDAIVFAVLFGTCGNSIFYRSGSDEAKRRADKLKLRFCHDKGDGLTFMEIYKEWVKQPDRRQFPWCLENKISAKILRGARETILEIIAVLRKEYQITVDQTFKRGEESVEHLQKFVLYAFFNNICYHMGHEKMGYFVPDLDQRVYVHPSSALKALGDSSDWLVYGNFLRTSRDFITTVTPIREEWITEIANEKKQHFDVEISKSKKLFRTHTEHFGVSTMAAFIGAKYTNIRRCEDMLSKEFQTPIVLEVERDKGDIHLFSTLNSMDAVEQFKNMVKEVKESFQMKSREFQLGSKPTRFGGVRIVIGVGGEGQMILLPNEYRSIYIVRPHRYTKADDVINKFSEYGEIIDTWQDTRSGDRWGKLTFESPESALDAVLETQDDEFEAAIPEFKFNDNHDYQFKAKLTWCRRPLTGLAFVDIDPADLPKASRLGRLKILDRFVNVNLDRKSGQSLCLRGIPQGAQEEDIRESLISSMRFCSEDEEDRILRINLLREKVKTTERDLRDIKEKIESVISRIVPDSSFLVDLSAPRKDTDFDFQAFVRFKQIEHGEKVCRKLTDDIELTISNQIVQITPDLSTSINVTKNVYEKMLPVVKEYIEILRTKLRMNFHCEIKPLNKNRVSIRIFSEIPKDLSRVRSILATLLKGEVMECWRNDNYRFLFLQTGRTFLNDLEKTSNVHIAVDGSRFTISIYGQVKDTSAAQIEINKFLEEVIEGTGREISLNSADQPKGLMKALIKEYGLNLEILIEEERLNSALLNHSTQVLKLMGTQKNVDKAFSRIAFIARALNKTKSQTKSNEELPECSTCFMTVEHISKLYRLEYCGHAYCLDCLHQQIKLAIQNKDLPILCGGDGCQEPFVWHDFLNTFRKFNIEDECLVNAAVDKFVMKNRESYRHCLSAECPMVYRITLNGALFVCGECRLKICTTCHVEYHDGLTCEMFKSISKEELSLAKFLGENKDTVKICPKCKTLIEKTYGCHHMSCKSCDNHFCWLCLASFGTSKECYTHIAKNHGGINNY
ncbi:uncharacterized protein LOC126825302 [Patella vulgata]|uniref:uncharacterized protein LOC126825302 n=1 Tax=Patella vulgata TaxID=6465 RepID=UPI00217F62B4|nr:uncharacterized protein LOC126825302 [Patella vulgata]